MKLSTALWLRQMMYSNNSFGVLSISDNLKWSWSSSGFNLKSSRRWNITLSGRYGDIGCGWARRRGQVDIILAGKREFRSRLGGHSIAVFSFYKKNEKNVNKHIFNLFSSSVPRLQRIIKWLMMNNTVRSSPLSLFSRYSAAWISTSMLISEGEITFLGNFQIAANELAWRQQ